MDYDFLVLGGGSAGYAAARTALEYCGKVAVVDGAKTLGGLCILRGCMPSKTLIYSAEVLHLAQRGADFGLKIPHAEVDSEGLHERKKKIIGEFAEYRQEQLTDGRFDLIRSKAKFVGKNEIELDDGRRITAERILIATGSKVKYPPVEGLDLPGVWTSDDVLDLSVVPKSIIVLGAGSVACELAQFLRRIGSAVIQIQRSEHILSGFSDDSVEVVEHALRDDGIILHTGTQLEKIEKKDDGFTATFTKDGETHVVEAQHVLNAMGRKPNTAQLGLDDIGVETRKSGHIIVDANQQSSVPGIYAAGDVCGPYEIVHLAIIQGENAAKASFGEKVTPPAEESLLQVVFTDPQLAYVGLTEEEMSKRGMDFVSADYPFDDHGKSILMEAKYGYVKTWMERGTNRLLAAECVGKDASELIHAMSVAVHLRAKVDDLIKAPWYHPTLAEIWSYPLEDCWEAGNHQ